MSKIAIIYWSGTGNTQAMAEAIAEGAKTKGKEVELFEVSEFNQDTLDSYDILAFGCPSMGAEVLEESEFEPLFESIEDKISGKEILLFGSYGWGDGEWMRNWEERSISKGAKLIGGEGIICQEAPDDACIDKLKNIF